MEDIQLQVCVLSSPQYSIASKDGRTRTYNDDNDVVPDPDHAGPLLPLRDQHHLRV